MCLRALVPITLALIWTSSLTGWSTTAHPLIGRASLSGIVPRGGPAIPISKLTEGILEEKRQEYKANPSKPLRVGFKLKSNEQGPAGYLKRKEVQVQIWNKISNSAAYALTIERNLLDIKIPTTDTPVPVVVTGYFSRSGQQYPFGPSDKRAEDAEAEETSQSQSTICLYEWPVLYVAAFDPPTRWKKGTAVWTHLLLVLGRDRESILRIAHANPALSQMLYEKLDRVGNSLGFQLLDNYDRVPRDLMKVVPDSD